MFTRNLGSSQSMIRLVGVLAIAVVVAGCGAKGNDREIAKLEEQLVDKQATLVAVQDEIAETNATIEALRAEDVTNPTSQATAVPVKPTTPKGEFHFVPVDIQKEDTGDGWTNYIVLLAAVNDSDETVNLSPINERVRIGTEEGFEYSGNVSMRLTYFTTDSGPYSGLTLLPGFRFIGTTCCGSPNEPITLEFQAASGSHPVIASSTNLGEVNLEGVEEVTFPVSFPVSTLPMIEDIEIEISTAGTVVFGLPRIELESGRDYPNWYLTIPTTFTNESTGYDTVVGGTCELADGNGVFQSSGRSPHGLFSAGPGQTNRTEIRFGVGRRIEVDHTFVQAANLLDLSVVTLYCYGDEFELLAQVSNPPVVDQQQ